MSIQSGQPTIAAALSWTNSFSFGWRVPRADIYLLINSANASSFGSLARMRVESRTCPPLTIRDYLRHSNLNVTNKYLQATADTKRMAQDKLVGAILPTGLLSQSKTTLIQ